MFICDFAASLLILYTNNNHIKIQNYEKSIICYVFDAVGGASFLPATEVPMVKSSGDHLPTIPDYGKTPIRPWYIDVTNNIITMSATPCDYTLYLYDEDGEVAYSVFVPAGTTQVILPTTLSGDFELRFETDTYYYYGYISL